MSKVQMLRALVKQRLTAAAEEIFGLFERTIAEYEEELCRSKEENERQQKLLDAVFNPQLQLNRAVSTDVQQLSVVKEEVLPEQQELSSSLDQEDPEPPHIKEEQEELWTSQEGEQLQDLEEADIKFPFSPVSVKSEDDEEEKPQSSDLQQRQTEQMETGVDGEDCGGPEPTGSSDLGTYLQPDTDDKAEVSEPETENSDDWKETREPQSGVDYLINAEVPVNDLRCSSGEKPLSCSVCGRTFGSRGNLNRHMRSHTGQKPFSCSICNKSFAQSGNIQKHMRIHTGEKPFSCPVCEKAFVESGNLKTHMRTHTGEKPFHCAICMKYFAQSVTLQKHMTIHTGEKPFSCSICKKSFAQSSSVQKHMRIHTGEKLFSCPVCGKGFTERRDVKVHLRCHTGEKPFSCSVCERSFTQSGHLHTHMRKHSGAQCLLEDSTTSQI